VRWGGSVRATSVSSNVGGRAWRGCALTVRAFDCIGVRATTQVNIDVTPSLLSHLVESDDVGVHEEAQDLDLTTHWVLFLFFHYK
jgi:hypothetical protein